MALTPMMLQYLSIKEQNPDSIAIPGYEMLQLTADTKKQTLSFPNPSQNMCYFQLSLYLEDGTLLWESEDIKAHCSGKGVGKGHLSQCYFALFLFQDG